jgi:hypothetical protein
MSMQRHEKPIFVVTKTKEGYEISLPKDLLTEFPHSFRSKITLSSSNKDKIGSTIVGVGIKQQDIGIKIRSDDLFKADLADTSLKIDIRVISKAGMEGDATFLSADFDAIPKLYSLAGVRRCRGCPRDRTLRVYRSPWGDVGDSICYCILVAQ